MRVSLPPTIRVRPVRQSCAELGVAREHVSAPKTITPASRADCIPVLPSSPDCPTPALGGQRNRSGVEPAQDAADGEPESQPVSLSPTSRSGTGTGAVDMLWARA